MATSNVYKKQTSMKCECMIFEICERTDRQTNKHADRNTLHSYRGRSNYSNFG